MMYSEYKLNNQGDNIQPWHTSFPICNQYVVPRPVLTVASWPAYRFLRRQVRWSCIPIFLRIFHSLLWSTVKGFGVVNKAEVDAFLELSCFFDDPKNVGNLISGSSAFSKFSLNFWKFSVQVLLRPGLENFKHYFASLWDECNCQVVAWDLWRRSPLSSIPPPYFGTRSNNREGTQPHPSTENWIKALQSMALTARTRPSFSLSQKASLPSESFLKPLILLHQRADRLKTTEMFKLPHSCTHPTC